jgi:hypothetical protein
MEFRFQGEKLTIHPNFRMCLVFKNRCDIHRFMTNMGEVSMGFMRVFAFDDNVDYLLKDTAALEEYIDKAFFKNKLIKDLLELWRNFNAKK